MAITRIQLLSVPVSSPDRALEFYVELLGFELLRNDPMGPDMRWVQIAPKGAPTSVSLVTWFDSMAPGSMKGLMFETDTFEEDIERLKGASVTVSDVQQEPWGRYVMFDDPDGNGIILRALGSEAWAEH
jgi:catechol 2,3-dioxygenase-like lactoylglutathione lyase family enzyme